MYFTDRGIEELTSRRGEERVTLAWVAERMRDFTNAHPGFETAVDRLATWLARDDDDLDGPDHDLDDDLHDDVHARTEGGRSDDDA